MKKSNRHRAGLGMIELLVALSISAALLVATAVAIDASFTAYQANQEESSLMQRARISLYRVTESIRTTQTHSPYTTSLATQFSGGSIVTDTGISMYDLSNTLMTYRLDAPNQKLLAVIGGTTYTMAEGVTAFSVKLEPMRSDESVRTGGSWDLLRRATITISVHTNTKTTAANDSTGQETVTLSAAVVPRRNAW